MKNKQNLNILKSAMISGKLKKIAFYYLFAGTCAVGALYPSYTSAQSNPLERALNPNQPQNIQSTSQGNQNGSALPTESSDARPSSRKSEAPAIRNLNQPSGPSEEELEKQALERKKKAEKRKKEIREQAFEAALNGLVPLEPDEIREVLKKYDKTREAIETPYYPYPKPTVSVLPVSLDPGAPLPELKLATGHVSTVSILDATGEPWPIEDISWAGDFQFAEAQAGGHIFRITPLSEFAHGNLSMRLVGLKTPITVTLKTQREVVQYRVDIRMPRPGPNAQTPLIDRNQGLQAGDTLITTILDGTAPSQVEKLKVSGVDGRTTAYRSNGMVYLRTPLTLLSPGWISSARSGDGTSVFVLNDTPLVLLSDEGKMQRARLKEDKDDELL